MQHPEPVLFVEYLLLGRITEHSLVLGTHVRYGLRGVGVDGFLHVSDGRYLLYEVPEAVLAQAQRLLDSLALPPYLHLPELALDGGAQPAHVLLGQVVVGPRLHDLHRRVLPDLARDDDERDVVPQLPQQLQGVWRPEAGHVVVGDNDLERLTPGLRRT